MERVVKRSNQFLIYGIFLLICLIPVDLLSQDDNLQETKVSLNINDKSISYILSEIEIQSGVSFSYESNLFDEEEIKSINLENVSIKDILEILFYDSDILYATLNDQIVIYREKKSSEVIVPDKKLPIPTVPQVITITNTDTVVITKIDTLIIVKTDTVVNIEIDTVFQEVFDTITEFIKIKTSVFDKYNSHWSLRMIYQVNAFENTYTQLHPNQNLNYNRVKKSESSMISYSVGMSAVYTFGNYNLSAGLASFQINEGVLFDYNQIILDSSLVISNVSGALRDSGFVINADTISYFYSGNNKYKYVSLPISLGVKFCMTPKLNIGFDVFLYLNFLTKVRGMTISQMEVGIESFDISNFRRLSCSLFLNPFLEYDFLNGLSIYLSPNIGWQLNSDFIKTYFYEKKRFFYGGTIGLQYNF